MLSGVRWWSLDGTLCPAEAWRRSRLYDARHFGEGLSVLRMWVVRRLRWLENGREADIPLFEPHITTTNLLM